MRTHPTLARTVALAVGSLAATAVLAGCAGSDDEPDTDGSSPSSSESGSESAEPDDESAAPTDEAVVELLDAGDGELRELRVAPSEGDVTTTDLAIEQRVEVTGQPSADAVTISTPYETEVESVTDDGIDTVSTYLAPSVSGGPDAAAVEQTLGSLEGAELTATQLPTGQTTAADIDVPDDADPTFAALAEQLTAQFSQASAAFPDEAVGEGARWTVTQQIESGLPGAELTFEQVSTYTLTSFDGDDYELAVDTEQTVVPGDAGGFDVEDGGGTASGTITGRLDVVGPLTSQTEGNTTIRGTAGGRAVTASTETSLDLTTETP